MHRKQIRTLISSQLSRNGYTMQFKNVSGLPPSPLRCMPNDMYIKTKLPINLTSISEAMNLRRHDIACWQNNTKLYRRKRPIFFLMPKKKYARGFYLKILRNLEEKNNFYLWLAVLQKNADKYLSKYYLVVISNAMTSASPYLQKLCI